MRTDAQPPLQNPEPPGDLGDWLTLCLVFLGTAAGFIAPAALVTVHYLSAPSPEFAGLGDYLSDLLLFSTLGSLGGGLFVSRLTAAFRLGKR